jgi:long-subunit fatty acid transport protein
MPVPEPEIKFTSSLNPVGSGARALAMGGAFIALADDATAASWNPAGLKHLLRPEVSIVGSYNHRTEHFSFDQPSSSSNRYSLTGQNLNYLSLAYPFTWRNNNFVVSFNYQNLYSLDRRMHFQWNYLDANSDLEGDYKVSYKQEGNLKAVSPAVAVFLTPRLFLGTTLNFWSDDLSDNGWIEHYSKSASLQISGQPVESYEEWTDRYAFSGFNMNFGLLWDIDQYLTLGAVLKTPFTARLKHKGESLVHRVWPSEPQYSTIEYHPPRTDSQKLSLPLSYGIGLAVRPSDRLTFDLDFYRIEWDGYVLYDAGGREIDPITSLPKKESSIKPTHHIRFGGEYVFLLQRVILSSRLGLFYDPEPARGQPNDFFGFGLGAGITAGPVALDWAFQYRFGHEVEGDSIKGENSPAEVKQYSFYYSLIYYF